MFVHKYFIYEFIDDIALNNIKIKLILAKNNKKL